jgi:hypothetical protein
LLQLFIVVVFLIFFGAKKLLIELLVRVFVVTTPNIDIHHFIVSRPLPVLLTDCYATCRYSSSGRFWGSAELALTGESHGLCAFTASRDVCLM